MLPSSCAGRHLHCDGCGACEQSTPGVKEGAKHAGCVARAGAGDGIWRNGSLITMEQREIQPIVEALQAALPDHVPTLTALAAIRFLRAAGMQELGAVEREAALSMEASVDKFCRERWVDRAH